MLVLGIETSCDETAVAVVNKNRKILSNVILTQIQEHKPYGGIVPELAARAHLKQLHFIIDEAMKKARINFTDITAIAATAGPGLIGGLLVGVTMAKAMASVHEKPFLAINHLAGHALIPRLTDRVKFPYLLLLTSGGHCQLLVVEGADSFNRIGTTKDDALGEVFDKVAKMLGLGIPGGPVVQKCAEAGNSSRFLLPRPMLGRTGCDFSFSGLKTAVRFLIEKFPANRLTSEDIADICASFQLAATEAVVDRTGHAIDICKKNYPRINRLVISGGVAANTKLRRCLKTLTAAKDFQFTAPPIDLCTDNAVMIAWAALEKLNKEQINNKNDDMSFKPRPRWPLSQKNQLI
ncbi:MAG: tRNA N6-adenosine threonylcarbamoyltransferase [Alphaproteobacteria bacterium MarineAlpha3_Bin5]|nr:tRNA (adenosine(37)-N6)-threonylcarbamoyltransferase complex transferase subunit TsaD [Magnetovibrio sp.]PPR76215.1 MAG: tRNA N6-adenosine threonylcarbamoyltransferase [Alphaproteobacteria bacterium MarineAlpha3_Bin5]